MVNGGVNPSMGGGHPGGLPCCPFLPPAPAVGQAAISCLENPAGMQKPLSVGLSYVSFTQQPACLQARYLFPTDKRIFPPPLQ